MSRCSGSILFCFGLTFVHFFSYSVQPPSVAWLDVFQVLHLSPTALASLFTPASFMRDLERVILYSGHTKDWHETESLASTRELIREKIRGKSVTRRPGSGLVPVFRPHKVLSSSTLVA
ncbi:hypothetical protein K435DRAFT_809074 [Dendrothele bispora CBS 962.96]|uniref:Secreted protein n=1 Tax=Dendrothele bispora (strain CBS 962.96) TaxID=1314807 RepID=A0A4V4HC15_DENBC|nr:hypothetical protein K435DRAFT_809074 [Dendrothele bispora CBS 962.96]